MKNYVVFDLDERSKDTWEELIGGLSRKTQSEWEFYGRNIGLVKFHSFKRYLSYFTTSWRLFKKRSQIRNILSIQQFYGLIFAFYCRLFKVKKNTKLVVLSFIYKEKPGILGLVYRNFIRYIITSEYIDKLIVHSASEPEYYSKLLDIEKDAFKYIPLGVTNDSDKYEHVDESEFYVLSVGNSNRDFAFVESSLEGQSYKVKIFSDEYPSHINGNIHVCSGVSADEYYKELAGCFCVVIILKDPFISSGQLVLLQSYAFGKPVIINRTNGIEDYLDDDCSIIIDKDEEELRTAIRGLINNKAKRKMISTNARETFNKKYSLRVMGERIGDVFKAD